MRNMWTMTMVVALVSSALLLAHEAHAQNATNLTCSGCVDPIDIADNAVTGTKIRDNAVGIDQLGPGVKPAGADFSGPRNVPNLATTDTVIASVTMNLPAPGVVILNSGGWAEFIDNPSSVWCSITKGMTVSVPEPIVVAQNHNVTNARAMPVATTRGFRETLPAIKPSISFVSQPSGTCP